MRRDFLDGRVTLHGGDCLAVIRTLDADSIDSVVTDPPYALVSIQRRFGKEGSAAPVEGVYRRATAGFMGKQWDTGETAFAVEFWAEVLRVLKPGGHVIAFSGTRTYHRLACAIEDAGFEIRDMVQWLYGSGFPKSHDVAKSIDKAARGVPHGGADPTSANHGKFKSGCSEENARGQGFGAGPGQFMATPGERSEREYVEEAATWQGWGTALKPACEPVVLARKPLIGTVAANVLAHGTGALNIDGCRILASVRDVAAAAVPERSNLRMFVGEGEGRSETRFDMSSGRWPANVIHDGSVEVIGGFPDSKSTRQEVSSKPGAVYGNGAGLPAHTGIYGFNDEGSAARFFYSAKADAQDRIGSKHPTVKPVDLMRYLCRLVTPAGGVVLDPFAGTGTTGQAAFLEGFRAVLIEREAEYQADIARRMALVMAGPDEKARELVKARGKAESAEDLPLFGGGGMKARKSGRLIYGTFARDEPSDRSD